MNDDGEIKFLPESTINRIAAGEVIERPGSVVKELVENSIDAGATQIEILISDGGRKLILVRDNGKGISPQNLKLAVARHATSKIRTADDLFSVTSFGFRGEALASVASVSQLTITSRLNQPDSVASELKIDGGEILSQTDSGHPIGTTVAVRHLFYKVPARLKFLKSPETEMAHIVDHVTKVALSHPEITFKLLNDERTVLSATKTSDFKNRITDLFGSDIADACYAIKNSLPLTLALSPKGEGISISGYVGHPMISRSHQKNVYLFVNGRTVKDKVIFHAVMEGYRDLLMKGKYPFCILFLNVPCEMVDVNVHPAKAEVRFSDSNVVHQAVARAVRGTLDKKPWEEVVTQSAPVSQGSLYSAGDFEKTCERHSGGIKPESKFQFQVKMGLPVAGLQHVGMMDLPQKKIEFGKTPYGELQVIGQFLGTYILCEGREKLALIDQHAAHERIGFEKLLLKFNEGNIPSELLLIPQNFDLKPSDCEILKKYLGELNQFGFEIEFFGGNTFIVKAVPVILKGKIDVKNLILDLVGDIIEKGKLTSLKDRLHDVLASMSCHGAIRAHHRLSPVEMRSLIDELDQYQFTSFCPHGRPVMVEVQESELERWFKRSV